MNGYELAVALREQCQPRKPLLIAVTGMADDATSPPVRRAGFAHHLTKPLDLDVLFAILKNHAGDKLKRMAARRAAHEVSGLDAAAPAYYVRGSLITAPAKP